MNAAQSGTKSEYAAHAGTSAPYVSKLNRQGRLVTFISPDGRELVDFEATDRKVRDTADMGRARSGENARRASSPSQAGATATGVDNRVESIFRQAQAQERAYQAKITELEYRRRVGELVPVAEVEAEHSRLLASIREAFSQLPARVVPLLVANPGVEEMDMLLRAEINSTLIQLADSD